MPLAWRSGDWSSGAPSCARGGSSSTASSGLRDEKPPLGESAIAPARAERPPQPKQQADLIVTGQVGKVYTNTDPADVNSIVEIEVRSIEKGQGVRPGQILDARCFQRRRDAPRVPAAYGHHQV